MSIAEPILDDSRPAGSTRPGAVKWSRWSRRGRRGWRCGRVLLVPLAIVVLAAVLRFDGITRQSLWYDEIASLRIAQTPWPSFLARLRESEITPPLYYVLLKFWTPVFGTSELSLRAPSALLGAAAVWLIYALARQLFGRTEAVLAAFLLATSRYAIEYSQEARAYSLLVALSLASTLAMLRLLDRPSPRREFSYWLATAMLLYSHLYGIFVLAAQNVGYACRATSRSGRPKYRPQQWANLQLGVALAFAPCLLLIHYWYRARTQHFWIAPFTLDQISETFRAYAGGVVTLVAILVFLVIGAVRRSTRPHLPMLLSWLLLPVVVPVMVSQWTLPMFTPRYGIVAIVPMFLLAAAGIGCMRWRIAQVLVALVLGLMALGSPNWQHKDDWRGAGAYLTQHLRPGDEVVINEPLQRFLYDYYVHRPDVRRRPLYWTALPFDIPLPDGRHAWVVLDTPRVSARDVIERGHWRVVSQKAFDGILILELDEGRTDAKNALPPEQRFSARRG